MSVGVRKPDGGGVNTHREIGGGGIDSGNHGGRQTGGDEGSTSGGYVEPRGGADEAPAQRNNFRVSQRESHRVRVERTAHWAAAHETSVGRNTQRVWNIEGFVDAARGGTAGGGGTEPKAPLGESRP